MPPDIGPPVALSPATSAAGDGTPTGIQADSAAPPTTAQADFINVLRETLGAFILLSPLWMEWKCCGRFLVGCNLQQDLKKMLSTGGHDPRKHPWWRHILAGSGLGKKLQSDEKRKMRWRFSNLPAKPARSRLRISSWKPTASRLGSGRRHWYGVV